MAEPSQHEGQCLCGGVRYRVTGALAPIEVCYCGQCRRAQGGPFATNIPVAANDFELLAGAELIAEYESSPGKQRCFCRRCGSPLFSKRDSLPGVLRLRAGLLQGELSARVGVHRHVDSVASWWRDDRGGNP